MNRTMIALIAVTLGALVPVPTAQGANLCEPTMTTVEDALTSVVTGPNLPDVCRIVSLIDPGTGQVGLCEDGTGVVLGEKGLCVGAVDIGGVPDVGGKPPCPRSEDDAGFGGTHVTCYYHCAQGDELHITVTAKDTDAEVSGYTDCGGAHADCKRLPVHCEGLSVELAQHPDFRGCVGDSHEFYSSEVTVTCLAVGPGIICMIIDCGFTVTSGRATCLAANPAVPSAIVDGLLSQVVGPGPVNSFVVMQFERVEGMLNGWAATYDARTGSCWVGAL